MKAIKLNYEDSCIFGTKVTLSKCDFLKNNMDSFMLMFKSQGSTFWLRFLMSFKDFLERKFANNTKQLAVLLNHVQFIRVLHYLFIHIHKKIIEGSNTSVKKFVNNLIILGVNSPEYMDLAPIDWLKHLKTSKHLQNVLNNLLGLPDPSEYNEFIVLLYNMYSDFVSSLCSLFEHWYFACDLTEEELKTIDSKIIYWLPNFNIQDKKIKTLCFEKYISGYWKNELQKMLLTENIHEHFDSHESKDCCDYFEKEKNIFHIFSFTSKNAISLMKMMAEEDSDGEVETITEVTLKDLCILQPRMEKCPKHKKCYIKISHNTSCREPFICNGSSPCTVSCEYNFKKQDKDKTVKEFWKNVSVEVIEVNKKTRDVMTVAEAYENNFETYLHFPLSMLKYSYTQCLSELYNFDFDPRRTEAVNRLRKKLRDKQNSSLLPVCKEDFKESFFRMNLMEFADTKMVDIEYKYCILKEEHHFANGVICDCFLQLVNSIGNNSTDVFGRVVYLAKTSFSVPVVGVNGTVVKIKNGKKIAIPFRLDAKNNLKSEVILETKNRNNKLNATFFNAEKLTESCTIDTSKESQKVTKSVPLISFSGNSKKNIKVLKSDDLISALSEGIKNDKIPCTLEADNISSNVDEEVDEILKLIGIGSENISDMNPAEADNGVKPKKKSVKHSMGDSNSNEDTAVENFFNLIGLKDSTFTESSSKEFKSGAEKSDKKVIKLRICAFCHKKETERKTFKRCSKCKEENFPEHRYYCSRECLIEDWTESHQEEHLRKQKLS